EGGSPAPMNEAWVHEREDWLRKYHLTVDWSDLRGYFRRLRRVKPAINVAVVVGAAQVRGTVVGLGDVQPNAAQLAQMQRLVEQARASGVDVTADAYPYVASANKLSSSLPEWVNAGSVDDMVARLRDPALRDRIAKETGKDLDADAILLVSCVDPGLKKYMGKKLAEVAKQMGVPPEIAVVQLVAEDRGQIGVVRFTMKEEDVEA